MSVDPRVDAYIEKSAAFARPILCHFRDVLHSVAPEAVETIKWGMPFFEHKGRPIAMMAAFKAHAGIGIFDGSPMAGGEGMGQFGKLASVADLPDPAALAALVGKAVTLVESGTAKMRTAKTKPPLEMPDDLAVALAAVPAAAAAFSGFPPSARREYLEWVLEAKQPATRTRRIETTVAQCAEGKRRYWAMAGRG
jgi:uncharacterized protein YdeI (YjbR/CyaY-like superfamily)